MSSTSAYTLVLGDQLFSRHPALAKDRPVVMVETGALHQRYNYHCFKLAFVYACMREYADSLRAAGYTVHYYDLDADTNFEEVLAKHSVARLHYLRPTDKRFRNYLQTLCENADIETEVTRENPMFLTPPEVFADFFAKYKQPYRMASFYQQQRVRFDLFVDEEEQPYGGRWSFDKENRRKTPNDLELPERRVYESRHYAAVCADVEKHFPNNPGNLPELYLPVTRQEATEHLAEFLEKYFPRFGAYEDALDLRDPLLYHSVFSALLNIGLLTPAEVLDALRTHVGKHPDILDNHFNSVEGFVRQIVGWREWMWGLYEHVYPEDLSGYNFFDHRARLPKYFYFEGLDELENLPLRHTLEKTRDYAYNHHIERLMVLGNWMTLSGYGPHACFEWFMEMYVDAYDWVMVGNVYGMGLFADGGVFATKPYISSANYLRKMSHYGTKKKGDWGEEWDTKFWDFLFKHEDFFAKQPRMNMLIKSRKKKRSPS